VIRLRRDERSTPPPGEPAQDAPAADAAISAAAHAANRGVPGVRAATELRTDLIFRLRQAIAEGAYEVDPGKVAERLADRI